MNTAYQLPIEPAALEPFFRKPSVYIPTLIELLKAHGWQGNQRHLIEAMPHLAHHLDLDGMINVMQALNYECQVFHRIKAHHIHQDLLPCLYITKDKRLYVLKEKTAKGIECFNPSVNQTTTLTGENLTGTIFQFSKKTEDAIAQTNSNAINNHIKSLTSTFIQLFIISFMLNVLILATPLYIMNVYDKVIPTASIYMLSGFVQAVIIAFAGLYILQTLRSKILAHIAARLDLMIGNAIMERILYLPTAYTETATISSQLSRIKDFDNVREFLSGPLIILCFDLPFILLFMIVIALLGGWLAAIPIFVMLLFLIASLQFKRWSKPYQEQAGTANAEYQKFTLESLNHLATLRRYAVTNIWLARAKEFSANAAFSNYHTNLIAHIADIVANSVMLLAGLAIIGFGTIGVLNNSVSVGALIAIMILVWRVLSPLKALFLMSTRFGQIYAGIKQINTLLTLKTEKDSKDGIPEISLLQGNIRLSKVSMRYQPHMEPALVGVDLKSPQGSFIAIAGRTGAGKSTLLKLIAGLYTPQTGLITIDNKNIQQLEPVELRRNIAYVPQYNQLFYGTIRQNLLFTCPTANEQDINNALIAVNAYEAVKLLPHGLDTRITERNISHMSSALIQSLSVARALIKNAAILLLDEPSDSLDNQSDQVLMETLRNFTGHKTIILATHRPSYLKLAQQILVLEHGRIIDVGGPDEIVPKLLKEQYYEASFASQA